MSKYPPPENDAFEEDENELDLPEPDEADLEEESEEPPPPLSFKKFRQVCPNCQKPITPEMDSCPYCGDIIFRYLKDSTFAPRVGIFAKIFAVLVIALILLGFLAFLLFSLRII